MAPSLSMFVCPPHPYSHDIVGTIAFRDIARETSVVVVNQVATFTISHCHCHPGDGGTRGTANYGALLRWVAKIKTMHKNGGFFHVCTAGHGPIVSLQQGWFVRDVNGGGLAGTAHVSRHFHRMPRTHHVGRQGTRELKFIVVVHHTVFFAHGDVQGGVTGPEIQSVQCKHSVSLGFTLMQPMRC